MDMNDTIATAFPGSTLTTGRFGFSLGNRESNDYAFNMTSSGFLELFYRGEFTYCYSTNFTYHRSTRYTLESIAYHLPPCEVIRGFSNEHFTHFLVRGLDWWASIEINAARVEAEFGTFTAAHAQELGTRFKDGLHTPTPPQRITNFEVWTGDDFPTSRNFPDVHWPEVKSNYPAMTRAGLEHLVQLDRAKTRNNGRIIILHGPPGTGKTWAIRSLMTAWKQWAEGAVVIDPDYLLEKSNYFMTMLNGRNSEKTRLVIIEDADEIAEKNGTRGSNLSRLLNATDGLIGASSNLLVLLSTNAPPEALDRALLRPGRCLASIEFTPFSADEVTSRLGRSVGRGLTLAELYEEMGEVSCVHTGTSQPAIGQYL
jgi:hypothetical protein